MAAGVVTSFHCPAPAPDYFSLLFQRSPRKGDEGATEGRPEVRGGEGKREDEEEEVEEEEEEGEESEAQEDEDEGPGGGPASDSAVDVTKQLLRFADLISRDVQRYFGRCSDDQDACDIYSDSAPVATGGRLRYYDDLLKIARAGSPEAAEGVPLTSPDDGGGVGGLGPLAELFAHRGPGQGHGQPMIKRHLPLSFWTEPMPCCSTDGFADAGGGTPSRDGAHTDANASAHVHYDALQQHNAHGLDGAQPDFSDLLANWDPNLEFTHQLLIQERKQSSK